MNIIYYLSILLMLGLGSSATLASSATSEEASAQSASFNPSSSSSIPAPTPIPDDYIWKKDDEWLTLEPNLEHKQYYGPNRRHDDGNTVIISLTGGGIRGIIPLLELAELEKQTNRQCTEIADLMTGTSIGGLITLALTYKDKDGRLVRAKDFLQFFEQQGAVIFPSTAWWNYPYKAYSLAKNLIYPKYSSSALRDALYTVMGDSYLSDTTIDIGITAADIDEQAPLLLSNRTHPQIKRLDAGLATSAAPTIFDPHQITMNGKKHTFVDGGLWENCPDKLALGLAKTYYNQPTLDVTASTTMLSLGTGIQPIREINAENVGIIRAAHIAIDSHLALDQQQVVQEMQSLLSDRYLRLNPHLTTNISLDEYSEDNMKLMQAAAETQYESIKQFTERDVIRKRLERLN